LKEPGQLLRRASLLVALTGGISMGLEVLASRALSLIFGSSLQAFALVLIAFILGIGVGSSVVSSSWWRRCVSPKVTPLLLVAAAAWILTLIFKIESWVEFYRWAKTGLAPSEAGYLYHQGLIVFVGLVVLGIPAALIGAVLPLMIQTASAESELAARVGRLLTWNTMGAVVGVLLTGFVLMPKLGLRNAFAVLAFGLCMTALVYAGLRREQLACAGAAVVTLGAMFVLICGNHDWQLVLSSGAFRSRDTVYDPTVMQQRRAWMELVYYRDAPDATVSVEKSLRSGHYFLRVNGKTDASSRGDYSTQVLCAHLPLMNRPEAKDVFVLGLGSGITSGAVLAHPVSNLVVAENCKPVIEAAKIFQPFNNGALTDSRSRIVEEDARTVLKLSPQQYDVIISQPSNPWTAGIGSVFSLEYYETAASRLRDDGLMVQWFHVYEIHDGIVAMVIRTFGEVFPHFEIWDTAAGDIILVGGKQPWASNFDSWKRIYERPVVREQLESIGLGTPQQLLARQLASQRTAFAIAGAGPVQSDYFPMLEYEAPKAFYVGKHATLLRNYDERTMQSALLSDAKRQMLSSIADAPLRAVFVEFASVNPDLMQVLIARLNTNSSPPLASRISSVFHSPSQRPMASSAESPVGQPLELVISQLREPQDRHAAVQRLKQLLGENNQPGSTAAQYAARAAQETLSLGDYAATRALLDIGLSAYADDPQLNYLSRILEREGPQTIASAR
jgi:predicted membrane-bound spermidine synthase